MAKLSEPVGSLSEGAERLERLIKGVKDRQLSELHNAPSPKAVTSAFAVSPEEAWSRKFMTTDIGPQEFAAPQMPSIGLAAPLGGQPFRAAPAREPAPGALRPATIGQALARPARRRSWLGRFFFGD
ncbi:MAG: hypothetical protein WDN03_14770 [Rhizomicrobium sp.]